MSDSILGLPDETFEKVAYALRHTVDEVVGTPISEQSPSLIDMTLALQAHDREQAGIIAKHEALYEQLRQMSAESDSGGLPLSAIEEVLEVFDRTERYEDPRIQRLEDACRWLAEFFDPPMTPERIARAYAEGKPFGTNGTVPTPEQVEEAKRVLQVYDRFNQIKEMLKPSGKSLETVQAEQHARGRAFTKEPT